MVRWTSRSRDSVWYCIRQFTTTRAISQDAHAIRPLNIAALLRSSSDGTIKTPHHITINGFVRSIRKQKQVAFAIIDDGSSLEAVQAVLKPEQAVELSNGSAVSLSGTWQKPPAGTQQAFELQVNAVQQLGDNDAAAYPIQKKYQTPEYLRTLPHLRARLPYNALLLRLRSQVVARICAFFAELGFVQTHPPIITSSDCEGAGEVFTVGTGIQNEPTVLPTVSAKREFFRRPKYLTVSSQLHLEALALAVGKVWCLSPSFRAEKSDTGRHLCEFMMLEAEVCFVDGLDEVMDLVENLLRDIAKFVQASDIGNELLVAYRERVRDGEKSSTQTSRNLLARWSGMINGPWPRVTYTEAIKFLQNAVYEGTARFECPPDMNAGLQAEHERYLAETVGKQGPVFVTDYPRDQKPFYMSPSLSSSSLSSSSQQDSKQPQTVACFDLLMPDVCEVVGGSMREHRFQELAEAMHRHGHLTDQDPATSNTISDRSPGKELPPDTSRPNLEWYLELRRFGSAPHGGFGLGFDRLLGYLAGVPNIRDVVTFPRWYGRCEC